MIKPCYTAYHHEAVIKDEAPVDLIEHWTSDTNIVL